MASSIKIGKEKTNSAIFDTAVPWGPVWARSTNRNVFFFNNDKLVKGKTSFNSVIFNTIMSYLDRFK